LGIALSMSVYELACTNAEFVIRKNVFETTFRYAENSSQFHKSVEVITSTFGHFSVDITNEASPDHWCDRY
jgi:hypothetical protein